MSPNSLIAKTFACVEKKTSYLATFSIATHFVTLLKENAKKQNGYVQLIDESMNSELESSQMDVYLMFYDAFTV